MVNKAHFGDFLFLHLIFIIYSIISLLEKTASKYPFISAEFIFCLAGMIIVTGIYAVFWQNALKKLPLVIAYSNKGIVILWTMLLGAVFFSEKITLNNITGSVIIIAGIVLVSKND